MGFAFINELPMPAGIRGQFPLIPELAEIKYARSEEIKRVFTSGSGEFTAIIGPCSADSEESACDYAGRLVKIREKTKGKPIIIPRIYASGPRTTGEGYMGMIRQPDPEKRPDMFGEILVVHHMYMRVLREIGSSTADEMLYSESMNYLSGIMSYVAVGVRSVENQFHRLIASGCDVPIGMKDPTSGDLTVMLNSVVAAQLLHDFIFRGFEVQCPGNPLTHTTLRGVINKRGQCNPNYHYEDLKFLSDLYNKRGLQNPVCIVDTNHASSNKQYHEQIRIAKEALHSRHHSGDIENLVKDLMVEGCIKPGSQKIGKHCYGKSITDPCLG